jgi:hypothetical protein
MELDLLDDEHSIIENSIDDNIINFLITKLSEQQKIKLLIITAQL